MHLIFLITFVRCKRKLTVRRRMQWNSDDIKSLIAVIRNEQGLVLTLAKPHPCCILFKSDRASFHPLTLDTLIKSLRSYFRVHLIRRQGIHFHVLVSLSTSFVTSFEYVMPLLHCIRILLATMNRLEFM